MALLYREGRRTRSDATSEQATAMHDGAAATHRKAGEQGAEEGCHVRSGGRQGL
jgi:hypothetical protein